MRRWVCVYGAGTYSVEFDITKSQYYGLLPSVMSLDLLPYYSTIDDVVVKDIAEQLNRQLEGERVRKKANVLLAMVQQNVKYVSDEERFDGRDVWETPAYVLEHGVADCDGSADLFVSIAHNMGLDVVCVVIEGHMCAGVNIPGGHGKPYMFEGREYWHMETTDDLAGVGRFWGEKQRTLKIVKAEIPNSEFKAMLISE